MASVCKILEDSELIQDADWEPILALLKELDDQEGANSIKTSQHWDMALAAGKKTQEPDTPSIKEALGGDNSGEFQEAMIKEIEALVARGTWRRVQRDKLPKNARVIPTTWAYKIKRTPAGDFKSFKARFCVRGDLQKKQVSDIETYSPVAQWSSVRLMLILSILLGLSTLPTDFSNAFA